MNKKVFLISFLILSFTIFAPANTAAKQINYVNNSIYLLDEAETLEDQGETIDDIYEEHNDVQTCDGSDSILGDPENPESVAWLLQQVLNFIKIVGPLIVVVLSSIDFIQVIVKGDDEAMQKAFKKLGQRLVLAALLFFIPVIVTALLDVFGFTSSATCGIK